MDNRIIETTNHYKAHIKPFLTYDQFVEIQKIWFSEAKIDLDSPNKLPEMGKLPATVLFIARKKLVEFLVIKIEDEVGNVVTRKPDELPVPPIDGTEINDELKKISDDAAAAFDKKKLTTSPPQLSEPTTTN